MPELWSTLFEFQLLMGLLKKIQQLALRYAHTTFTVTEQLKESLVNRGADPEKITIVLNVPDERTLTLATRPAMISSRQHFTLICHGAIEERYGFDTILLALHRLRSEHIGVHLRILGKGSYLPRLFEQIQELCLDDIVTYLGYVPLNELIAELSAADAGVVAQKSSPYSNLVHTGKMYDYLSFEKPVIASRLRAVEAYFDEESVAYFEPDDPDDLARVIKRMCGNSVWRRQLVRNSQRRYGGYRWQQSKETYVSVSCRLAGENNHETATV
jgi:glycosyltransferase involved in cell wall biosynthesis